MMKMDADKLAAIREKDEAHYSAALNAARWAQPLVLRVQAKSKLYEGETRMNYQAVKVTPLDFKAESRRLLAEIQA